MRETENNKGATFYEGRMVLVKNVMSSSVMPPPQGHSTFLDYWEKTTGISGSRCAHEICDREATHGAVATLAFSSDRRRYVFPACETCARRTEMLYVKGPLAILES